MVWIILHDTKILLYTENEIVVFEHWVFVTYKKKFWVDLFTFSFLKFKVLKICDTSQVILCMYDKIEVNIYVWILIWKPKMFRYIFKWTSYIHTYSLERIYGKIKIHCPIPCFLVNNIIYVYMFICTFNFTM